MACLLDRLGNEQHVNYQHRIIVISHFNP